MAASWPKVTRVIGTRVNRLDGTRKASGRAKYSYDINRPGLLHAVFLPCPHAHALVKAVDYSAALTAPGVKGVYDVKKAGDEVTFPDEPIIALAAETERQAYDALRLVKVQYEVLGHCVKESVAKADGAPKVSQKDGRGQGSEAPDDDWIRGIPRALP